MESVVKALAEAFMEQNPDVTVNYSGTGSGTGIQAAIDGTVDLGLASRALKDEEKSNGAVENIVALDGVAVVVNPENGVTDLTVEQIAQIQACTQGTVKSRLNYGRKKLKEGVLALEARELIKGKVLENSLLSSREAAEALASATRSQVVQVIGTKFVLYRPTHKKDKKDKIVLVTDRKRK